MRFIILLPFIAIAFNLLVNATSPRTILGPFPPTLTMHILTPTGPIDIQNTTLTLDEIVEVVIRLSNLDSATPPSPFNTTLLTALRGYYHQRYRIESALDRDRRFDMRQVRNWIQIQQEQLTLDQSSFTSFESIERLIHYYGMIEQIASVQAERLVGEDELVNALLQFKTRVAFVITGWNEILGRTGREPVRVPGLLEEILVQEGHENERDVDWSTLRENMCQRCIAYLRRNRVHPE